MLGARLFCFSFLSEVVISFTSQLQRGNGEVEGFAKTCNASSMSTWGDELFRQKNYFVHIFSKLLMNRLLISMPFPSSFEVSIVLNCYIHFMYVSIRLSSSNFCIMFVWERVFPSGGRFKHFLLARYCCQWGSRIVEGLTVWYVF